MDFKQIEHSVLKFEPMPDNAPLHEQMCYFALRHLYEDYRRGVVNVQAAHDEKVRLRNAFERAVSTEQTRDMLRDEWQTGLKVSNEFRIRLHKALESGEGIDVLFPLCALPGFVDSKNEEKTERNAGYLVVSHSGGGMLRQGTRKGIRRTPANRGMRAHWVVKGLDISEDVCHGMCP